jgi:hypothetical protein
MLTLIPSLGYDEIAQKRIYHFLDMDGRYRAQISELVADKATEIEIEENMSYHSFVASIPYILLHEC